MSELAAWVRASRPPAQSYIFLPLFLGQALWSARGGTLDLGVFALVHLFGLFDQLTIVYGNDYADRESDKDNSTYTVFSGGSRVLVSGALRPAQLRLAGALTAALSVGCGLALGLIYGRWLTVPLAVLAILLFWAYSFGPLRLSYRGGGELLQMLGVGAVLPAMGYAAQAGSTAGFPWSGLAVVLPAQLACALATTLPDEPSDRRSSKRTAAVLWGPGAVKLLIALLQAAAVGALPTLGWLARGGQGLRQVAAAPAALTALGLCLFRSPPGSRGISLMVGCFVGATLSLVLGLSLLALLGRS